MAATNHAATPDQLEMALHQHPDLIDIVRLHDNAPLRLIAELPYIDVSPTAQERFVTAMDGTAARLPTFRQRMRNLDSERRRSMTMLEAWQEFENTATG